MTLYRVKLRPRSPWRTPWQADTLTGALCALAARTHGAGYLRERLIDPMLAGRPPFVLSDAFPGDLLPLPLFARLQQPPGDIPPKHVERFRWIHREDFLALRADPRAIPWRRLASDPDLFCEETTRHNTLARDSDASLEDGGLFSRPDTCLRRSSAGVSPRASNVQQLSAGSTVADSDDPCLSLYFRAAAADLLLDLLYELSLVGFGADAATGRGQFDLVGDPEPMPQLDQRPPDANGLVVLSTFQPTPHDPTAGLWETFPKFGKLGPDLGLSDVRKNTLIMFRPGACFHADPATPYLGRALPMDVVLPPDSAATLHQRNIEIIHPAFGLAIPANLASLEYTP